MKRVFLVLVFLVLAGCIAEDVILKDITIEPDADAIINQNISDRHVISYTLVNNKNIDVDCYIDFDGQKIEVGKVKAKQSYRGSFPVDISGQEEFTLKPVCS